MRTTSFYTGFFRGAFIAALIGGFALRGYHTAYHPEWTEFELFLKFWPCWLFIIACVLFAFLWASTNTPNPPRPGI